MIMILDCYEIVLKYHMCHEKTASVSSIATGRSDSSESALDPGRVGKSVFHRSTDSALPSHGRTQFLVIVRNVNLMEGYKG